MKYVTCDILFAEIPNEISLSFFISGCSLRCEGCHSKVLWSRTAGTELTEPTYLESIHRYKDMISCVLFMGGEWHEEELIHKLKLAQELGYKTALYTGEDDVSVSLKRYLTYLKTGRFIPQLGGLTSPTTNQRLINVSTGECLNHLFH